MFCLKVLDKLYITQIMKIRISKLKKKKLKLNLNIGCRFNYYKGKQKGRKEKYLEVFTYCHFD